MKLIQSKADIAYLIVALLAVSVFVGAVIYKKKEREGDPSLFLKQKIQFLEGRIINLEAVAGKHEERLQPAPQMIPDSPWIEKPKLVAPTNDPPSLYFPKQEVE